MKSFAGRFVSWFLFDVCLALIPCGIFAALVSASLVDGKTVPYGWLTVCCLLIITMLVRLFRAVKSCLMNKDVAVGWRFVAALLLGVLGISAGEPG